MHPHPASRSFALVVALACAQQATAQVFVDSPGSIPQGAPFNSSQTEQIDFADIDGDGDWDCAAADGGDCCSDQNRIWVNQGGLQGGVLGVFADETAARAPLLNDPSRDLEFADLDADGDMDLEIANSSQIVNAASRWWINQGGLQGGSAGFYADDTAARWVGLGGAGSSIPPGQVLPSGGYISFAQDHDLADLDADGDLDLVAATVGGSFGGQEPTRLFLNDGLGFFSEFNPSGFQLGGVNIANGNPALWAEGVQQHNTLSTNGAFADVAGIVQEVLVGDVDGDLDIDVFLVDRGTTPRLFKNRLSDTGNLLFRDFTGLAWPQGWGNGNAKYDAELADLDGDLDQDLYCMNWLAPFLDLTMRSLGNGIYAEPTGINASLGDDDASDQLDYDADGDLDVFVAGFGGTDKLLANLYAGGGLALGPVAGAIAGGPFAPAIDVDAADTDGDGDDDLMRAGSGADHLLENVLDQADDVAPRHTLLEQPADHNSGQVTPIRVHVLDNAGPDQTAQAAQHELRWSVDNGPEQSGAMSPMGGPVFRGVLPAAAVGNVRYFVRSTDEHGNVGESDWKALDTSGGCSGQPATYCTGKLNTDGCVPKIEFEGAPKVGGPMGFVIRGMDVLANANGLLIYSKAGPNSAPFNGGTLCVGAGLLRTPGQNSGGAGPCGGTLAFDFNAHAGLGIDPGLVAGQKVWAQYWYRDVASQGGTGLTNAVNFTLCP